MVNVTELRADFNELLSECGEKVRFKFFTGSKSTEAYDDESLLTQSGSNIWASGAIQPIKSAEGSTEAVLMAQGKITTADKRLYLEGSINVSGIWRVGIGSPIREECAMIPNGIEEYLISGSPVFKKVFIRNLPNGSLSTE